MGLGFRGVGSCGHNGVNDSQGVIFPPLDWGILDPVRFCCLVRCLLIMVRDCESGFSGIGKSNQEVGFCNCLPCPRNQFFPKSVHPVFGVLCVTDLMAAELEEFNVRDGWIFLSRIDQHAGTEVDPLPIQPLLSRILSSVVLHGFLRSMEITQESSSGGRGIPDTNRAAGGRRQTCE